MKTIAAAVVASLFIALAPSYGASDIERELKQLIDEREQAIAAASAPITARFKIAAEALLRRAIQNGDLEAANKIKGALGDQTSTQNALGAVGPLRDLTHQIAGTKWTALPNAILPGGLTTTLTFAAKSVEPGDYKYEALHDSVTITFNHGGRQMLMLAHDGVHLQLPRGPAIYVRVAE